ncbi:MAG: hypothetical protein AAF483_14375 [Planctomycetota bacterium]
MSNDFYSQQPQGYNPYAVQGTQQGGPGGPGDPIYDEIKKQALGSFVWGIIGVFFCGLILGIFAIYRGSKARKMIAQHGVGQAYLAQATIGLVCGIIGFLINLGGIAFIFLLAAARAASI